MLPSLSRRAIVCTVAALALTFTFSGKASASTVVVAPAGTTACKTLPSYTTISEAVANVPAGSTIYICPGIYPEQVVINKKLTLTGVSADGLAGATATGANNPVVTSPSSGVIVNSADLVGSFPTAAQILVQPKSLSTPISVSISNITVDGSNNGLSGCGTDLVGIYYQNASGTINHVTTRFQELDPSDFGCQDGLAIYVQSGYGTGGTATVTVENNSVHDYDKNGITIDGSGSAATVSANYVVGIGATPLIAQNGIQVSEGATGKISNNIVTDDVYVNSPGCTLSVLTPPTCTSATGILLYDSGGTSANNITVSGNTVSNTQGAIVAQTDGNETADYNEVSANRVMLVPPITGSSVGTILLDAIDLCSDNNTATSNTVFGASGAGIHLDSSCTEPNNTASGVNSTATSNTINEACAGVLLGNSAYTSQTGTTTYNVALTFGTGDSCPNGINAGSENRIHSAGKVKPQPSKH